MTVPGFSNTPADHGDRTVAEAKAVTETDSKVVTPEVEPKKATRRAAKAESK